MRTPPDPSSFRPRDLSELAFLGRKMFELSEAQICDMIRFWTMSISDYLDEYFEHPVIKGYLAVSAIIGTALGPMSPGSAYVLLPPLHGRCGWKRGRLGLCPGRHGVDHPGLVQIAAGGRGEIRAGKGVENILIRNGQATGVVLEGGDEVHGKTHHLEHDVKRTFLSMSMQRNCRQFPQAGANLQDTRVLWQTEHRARRRA